MSWKGRCLMKKAVALTLALMYIISAAFTASAQQTLPYSNYTYSEKDNSLVLGPQAYIPESVIYGNTLGTENFNAPADIDTDDAGNIYILDVGNNRIVVLTPDLALKNVIICNAETSFEVQGLNGAQGITVAGDNIYVCDTENSRILIYDKESGAFIRKIGAPKASALGDDFIFLPTRVSVDEKGNFYVISNGTYEGVINLNSDGEFLSFFASNKVTSSTWDLFWRRFSTKQQRKTMLQLIPQDFSSIDMDSEGFFLITTYTAVSKSMVKRVNPGGTDVLRRVSNVSLTGDPQKYYKGTLAGESSFCDISSGKYKIYACLDRTRGRIFCYNNDGYMLYNFGNISKQVGGFTNPVALTYLNDEKIAVVDTVDNSITVFAPTEYAKAINQGIMYQNNLDYESARQQWEKVLELNSNYELALIMIGRSYYNNGEYKIAMQYFQKASNREMYSNARKALRSEWIYDNVWIIISAVVLIVGGAIASAIFKAIKKKKSKRSF